MDDMDDDVLSPGFEPLIINETGDPDRSGLTITEAQLYPPALMKPYLQEMDDLLKSCEELTGIPFGPRFSESFTDASLRESSHSRYEEISVSPQAYLSTSYIDTHMDGCPTEDEPAQGPLPGMGSMTSRCGLTAGVGGQREMSVSSTGNELSEAMVEYEGQLRGMLAMLEGCMEETRMDFEPQDWATDASQDYVHIRKNAHLYRGATLAPPQQETPVKLETQAVQLVSGAAQPAAEEEDVSKDRRNGVILGSASNTSQHNLLHCCDSMSDIMVVSPGRSENTERESPDPLVSTTGLSEPLDSHDTMCGEETETRYMINESMGAERDMCGTEVDDSEMPADMRSGIGEFEEVGSQMEQCIQEVQHLEKRRKELLAEVLELRGSESREEAEGGNEEGGLPEEQVDRKVGELMDMLKSEAEGRREERKKEIQSLREDRAEEERRMWKVNLERLGLQEELRKLKRRLFTMTRDSMLSQSCLNNQQREVELLKRDEEKLQSMVLQLTEERCQLRSTQQQHLLDLQAELQVQTSSQTSNSQEELSECRRLSCGDIQQYVQGGLRALEDRYEPILLALLKRRDTTAEALVKAKEQAEELRAQLRPLRDEIQKLKLQRACLEEKLKLVHIHRREDVGQYKETVNCLEESSRELKTELRIQKKKTKEMEELRDSLSKQLLLYRAAVKDHKECGHEEKT